MYRTTSIAWVILSSMSNVGINAERSSLDLGRYVRDVLSYTVAVVVAATVFVSMFVLLARDYLLPTPYLLIDTVAPRT